MVGKANKQSSSNSGYFASLSRKKKRQKIIFTILAVVLGVGLVGSSMIWAFGDNYLPAQTTNVQQNSIEQQIADLEAQLKEEPKNTTIMAQLAKLHRENGDGTKAVENYVKALEIKPGDVELRKELGVTYFLLGDYRQAAVQIQKAIELKPEDAYAHFYAGQIYAFRSDDGRDVAKGISELEKFILIQKEGPDVEKAKQYIKELQAGQKK